MKKFCLNMSDIGYGANVIGIQHGYKTLANKYPELAKQINYIDHSLKEEDMDQKNKKFYNTVYDACLKVYKANLDCFKNEGFPILIGGDHSLALGSIKASMEYHSDNIGVIWIDAHTDINTFETSDTGHIHGTPVSSLLGINDSKYDNLGNKLRLKPENLVYFATRSIDYPEDVLVKKYNILNITDATIKSTSLEEQLDIAIEYLKDKVDKIHISLDLDSINPQYITGVSTPVDNGLEVNQPLQIIQKFHENFNIISLDIVEYNPLQDKCGQSLDYVVELTQSIENIMKKEGLSNE